MQERPSENVQTFLEKIPVEDELRLSIALQMIPADGIAGLINYTRPVDDYTRFMSYTFTSRVDCLSNDDLQNQSEEEEDQDEISSTHVVINMQYGIDACVILQLPSNDDELVKHIDSLLERACMSLIHRMSLTLTRGDEHTLGQIRHVDVFSNISQLTNITNFIEFHRTITQMKNANDLHRPLSYQLRPITDFIRINNIQYQRIAPQWINKLETTCDGIIL